MLHQSFIQSTGGYSSEDIYKMSMYNNNTVYALVNINFNVTSEPWTYRTKCTCKIGVQWHVTPVIHTKYLPNGNSSDNIFQPSTLLSMSMQHSVTMEVYVAYNLIPVVSY
jgi:hypothetical protein